MVGYHRETHHFREEKSTKELTFPQHTRFILPLTSPDKIIATLRGRYFSFMVTCRGGGPSILLTQDRSVAQKPHWGFCCYANASLPMAGRAGSSCKQRKTGSSRRGTPCCTYRYRMWILAGCVLFRGAPCFCFALNLLAHGFQPYSSNIPPGHRSESNRHSPADRCR